MLKPTKIHKKLVSNGDCDGDGSERSEKEERGEGGGGSVEEEGRARRCQWHGDMQGMEVMVVIV